MPNEKKEKASGKASGPLWLNRIESTIQWRNGYWNGDPAWRRAYETYRGKQWYDRETDYGYVGSDAPRDRITVNLTGSTILNIAPFLVARNPEFIVSPKHPDDVVSAMIQQAALNYEWKARDMQRELKRAVYDALIIGHGVIKTGYTLELDEARSKEDGEINYSDFVKADAPFIQRVNPFNFIFDPTGGTYDLRSARWCAEVIFVPLSDVLANKRYNQKVITSIKDKEYTLTTKNSFLAASEDYPKFNTDKSMLWDAEIPEHELIVLYEIYDKKFKKYMVMASGVEEPLLEKEWPYEYLTGFPYQKLDYIPIPSEPYGLGIPYWIEDQQFELNRIRTHQFEHRRRFNRKYEVVKGAVEESEETKLIEGEDGTIIWVQAAGSVRAIEDAPMSSDQQIVEQIIKADVQELTGSDALIRGGALPSRTTGTEVSTRANLFRLKLDDRVEDVEKFVVNIGRQVLQHIKANYTIEKAVKVAGKAGEYWITFTPEDIQGEFDIEVESISAEKHDPAVERQQAISIFQMASSMGPAIQQGQLQVDLNELFKWLLSKFNIQDVGRFFSPSLVVGAPMETATETELQSPQQEVPQLPSVPTPEQPVTPDINSLLQEFTGAAQTNSGNQGFGGF